VFIRVQELFSCFSLLSPVSLICNYVDGGCCLKFPEEEYRLPFFSENGFLRKQCSVCGEYFWTQDFHKENCGDAPCQDYDFIEDSPTKKKYSLSEMRETFISYFEKNSHKRIKPYPIIARWRDDLYVTIASIADFQPYVTAGMIPPPANPLVISQPCLRFLDIDKVGSTAGRHMTIFEMGGHHAFNYQDQEIYWKNDTVRLHHEFMTEELGVRSDLISYKEGTWEGGGNAGPDLEGCVKGLEVTTLVFMKYKVLNGKYYDMPIRVVDTGYGMERLTWLSRGSPSGFHAVYDYLLNRMVKMIPKLDEIPKKAVILSSKLSATEKTVSSEEIMKEFVDLTSVDATELTNALKLLNSVYTVLDHSKALIFMLAEGIVPSNVKVGYLSRLLFRRTYRLLRLLGIEDKLSEIIEMQIKYWSNDFLILNDMQGEILTALSFEEHKYRDTLQRGERLVYRLAEKLTKNKAKLVSIERLIELYESHGVPPEFVNDIMNKQNITVEVPDDFYTLMAKRHDSPREQLEKPIMDLPELPDTYPIYYDDAYIRQFKSKVLRVLDNELVVLEKSAFYPEGGGQPSDIGKLEFESGTSEVFDVQKIGNVIIHKIKGKVPHEGEIVQGTIDWDQRYSLMKNHVATHIINGAARHVLGNHVWQSGAQKGVDSSRLDISHWARLSEDEITRIELVTNQIVAENLPIEIKWMKREEAEETFGFRLYQGGVVPSRMLRVVSIKGWDVEACGGVYCKQTGEVGLIKIIKTERIQDGVERIIFSVGKPAIIYTQKIESELNKASKVLMVSPDNLRKTVLRVTDQLQSANKEIKRLRTLLARREAEELLREVVIVDGVKLARRVLDEIDQDYMIEICNFYIDIESSGIVVIFGRNKTARVVVKVGEKAIGKGVHAGVIASETASIVGGGGSGDPTFGQGGGIEIAKISKAMDRVLQIVKNQLSGG